mgnify:CR=1 FL=1
MAGFLIVFILLTDVNMPISLSSSSSISFTVSVNYPFSVTKLDLSSIYPPTEGRLPGYGATFRLPLSNLKPDGT